MVFIWNGINYEVVDDKKFGKRAETYRGYVTARRLFVALLEPGLSGKIAKVNKMCSTSFFVQFIKIICTTASRSMVQSKRSKC